MAVKVEKTPVNAPEFQSAGPQPNFKGSYPSKQKLFLSAVQTGTGAQQSIAHGLGAVPAGADPRPCAMLCCAPLPVCTADRNCFCFDG